MNHTTLSRSISEPFRGLSVQYAIKLQSNSTLRVLASDCKSTLKDLAAAPLMTTVKGRLWLKYRTGIATP